MRLLLLRRWRRSVARPAVFALLAMLAAPATSRAMLSITFDTGVGIVDGGIGDVDGSVNGKIDFSGIYGSSLYQVSGSLREFPSFGVGPSGAGAGYPISLTLTNFTAEAILGSVLNSPMPIKIESNTLLGSYAAGTASDGISAQVRSSAGTPIPAGTDQLLTLDSIISDAFNQSPINLPVTGTALPIGNPGYLTGPALNYVSTGHGPTSILAMTNPILSGNFSFSLGLLNDQFIMPSSYEIGYSGVLLPEPGSASLIFAAVAGLGLRRRRAMLSVA